MTRRNVRAVFLAAMDWADANGLAVDNAQADTWGTATLYAWTEDLEGLATWLGQDANAPGGTAWTPEAGVNWRGFRGPLEVRPGLTYTVRVIAATDPENHRTTEDD